MRKNSFLLIVALFVITGLAGLSGIVCYGLVVKPMVLQGGSHQSMKIPAGAYSGNTSIRLYNPNFFPVVVTVPTAKGCACLRAVPSSLVITARSTQSMELQVEPEDAAAHTLTVRFVTSARRQDAETVMYLSYEQKGRD